MTVPIAFVRDPSTGQILFDASGFPVYDNEANAAANTYGAMQTRIQDEVLGSATTAQIQNAIQDAIASYERESFWFNQARSFGAVTGSASDLQTVSGKEFYGQADLPILINMPHISKILVLAFANRYPLINRTISWIDDQSISTSWQGLPTDWCWQSGALRLYPVPNGGYPLIIDATMRMRPLGVLPPASAYDTAPPPPTSAATYSCWTNEAEALIRFEAKRLLFANIMRNPLQAAAMEREIFGAPELGRQGILAQLRRESLRRSGGPGRIRASRGHF